MSDDVAPVVEITSMGRGASIRYREGTNQIPFDLEFAMSPAVALMWGPKQQEWDARYPWAIGRQDAIYTFVGAEVVRQKAPGCGCVFDAASGELTILTDGGMRMRSS